MGAIAGSLTRIRLTPIPWIYFVHVRLLLILYLAFLPLLLLGFEGMTFDVVVFYVLIIGYVFCGLEGMSTDIENPFDDGYSDHPLDLYVFLNLSDVRYLVGQKFHSKQHFVRSHEHKYRKLIDKWILKKFPGYELGTSPPQPA